MPDKPIASLVEYYYLWKNKRKKSSVIDRQAKKLANVRSNENQNGSREGSSSAESEPDDKVMLYNYELIYNNEGLNLFTICICRVRH